MKIHRFIGPFDIGLDRISITDADVVNQIAHVLRLQIGERILLADGSGRECIVEIIEMRKHEIICSVVERSENKNEPRVHAVLYCAILKSENFELVVQKATEVGISEIVPLITQRTIKLDIKAERLEKIIKEAAEQSGRGRVPILHRPMEFAEAINDAKRNAVNYFCDIGELVANPIAYDAVASRGLFVGPEGGWTPEEVVEAHAAGCKTVSFGPLAFRGETAAIIASYLGVQG